MSDGISNTWRDMRQVRVPTAAEMDAQIDKDIAPPNWDDDWVAEEKRAKREVDR